MKRKSVIFFNQYSLNSHVYWYIYREIQREHFKLYPYRLFFSHFLNSFLGSEKIERNNIQSFKRMKETKWNREKWKRHMPFDSLVIRQDKSRCDFGVAGKRESLWIKEIIEFFVSLVCVCSLVYCVIRGLETFTKITSPNANFLIWCHIIWIVIKTWQKMAGMGRDGTCNIIFVHSTMCLFGTKWSLSE